MNEWVTACVDDDGDGDGDDGYQSAKVGRLGRVPCGSSCLQWWVR